MQERIRRGEVPNVSNPEEAENIVRQGKFTYEQVRNIAKAGTVESIAYDAVNGTIIATGAFGLRQSFLLPYLFGMGKILKLLCKMRLQKV